MIDQPTSGVAWFPETINALLAEMREQRAVTRQLVEVLREVRDELAKLNERNDHNTAPHPLVPVEAILGGG
jgi:hypothetical protein